MRCVDWWAGVVLTPPWLVVVTLVVAVCTFWKDLKWTLEKVLSAEVGWVDGQGQAVCGLVGSNGIFVVEFGMLCSSCGGAAVPVEMCFCSVMWFVLQKAGRCRWRYVCSHATCRKQYVKDLGMCEVDVVSN